MPTIALPMITALPSRAYTRRRASERSVKAIHSAAVEAAMAIATEAEKSSGS